jgi:hypothetical protein
MSLIQKVAAIVAIPEGIWTLNAVAEMCTEFSRKQVRAALHNARREKLVHYAVKAGQRVHAGVYLPGPAPAEDADDWDDGGNSGQRGVLPKVSSVWELASAMGAN